MSQYRFGKQPDTNSNLPEQERPTFNELRDNAEAGIVRRGLGRYLFSSNPERSIKMYTYLGMPLLRKAIMSSYGHLFPGGPMGNYRTNPDKSMIERSTRFTVGGSVFNEGLHTAVAANATHDLINNIVDGRNPTVSAIAVGVNTALVGLQRYNRARMSQRVNEELEAGRTFDPDYKNWLGIDGRSVENYETSLKSQAPEQQITTSQVIELPVTTRVPQPVRTPAVHY